MTATTMRLPRFDRLREAVGWLATAALLALVPKCLLCLLAYAGVGIAFGFAGPEICGASVSSAETWGVSFVLMGVAPGVRGGSRRIEIPPENPVTKM